MWIRHILRRPQGDIAKRAIGWNPQSCRRGRTANGKGHWRRRLGRRKGAEEKLKSWHWTGLNGIALGKPYVLSRNQGIYIYM